MTSPDAALASIALASAYQAECLATLNSLVRTTTYRPSRAYNAIGMKDPRAAVDWVRNRIEDGAEGLRSLAEIGRVEDSFEASVLHPRWARLFDEHTRETARTSLRKVATEVPAVAPFVARFLAQERLTTDPDLNYQLAGMTPPVID